MQLIRGIRNAPAFERGSVVTIGAFDGVHLGHKAVLASVAEKSRELSLPSVVVCFEPLPREYFSVHEAPSRLMNFREKFEALSELGIDYLLRIRFDEVLRNISALDFIKTIYVDGLNAKHITSGDDSRFGKGREGSFSLLQEVAPKYGFDVVDTASIKVATTRVSSSGIRSALEAADFDTAEQMLGQPYAMSGRVVYGRQLGRQLGFPTANVQIKRHRSPLSGVYVARLQLGAKKYPAVANLGVRPTLEQESIQAVLEVHVLGENMALYGQQVHVEFLAKIRDEQKFESLNALKTAISADAVTAKQWFKTALSA